uniref:Tubulin-tyrosine ligase n=1 Tax=viral metagenome TaxID=1070528 RepID=A0A6C0J356_9ZZZZ
MSIKKPPFYYLFKSEVLTDEEIKLILKKRGDIWEKYNLKEPQKDNPDFIYVDGKNEYDKQYYIPTYLKNRANLKGDNESITNKYNLNVNMKKHNDNKINKYLLEDHYINIFNIFKDNDNVNNYKKYFNNNKIWILKEIYGWAGSGIFVCENFSSFKNIINMIINKNKYFYSKINLNIYNKFKNSKKQKSKIEWILQEYINNPYLIDSKKFHFRVLYIYSNKKQFYYNKFLSFIAKEKYLKGDYTNKNIHDSRLKTTDKIYYFPDDFYDLIGKKNIDNIIKQINELFRGVKKVIKAKCYDENNFCFHQFGCDIMLTDNFNIKLIEINDKLSTEVLEIDKTNNYKKYIESLIGDIVDKYFIPQKEIKFKSGFIEI